MPPVPRLPLPLTVATFAVLGVATLAGCSGGERAPGGAAGSAAPPPVTSAPPSTAPSSAGSASPGSSVTSAPPRGGGSLTLQEAMAAALEAEKGTVVGAELDRFGEGAAWRVDVRRSRSVTVEVALNTATGAVLGRSEDDTDDEAATVPRSTARRAVDAAEDRVPDGQATQVELDTEGGDRVWQVSVRRAGADPVEVTLDAESGRFVRQSGG